MNHLSEEELVLHYYGEEAAAPAAAGHLDTCPECRARYGELQRALNVVSAIPVPERGPEYGAEVWRRIEPRLAFEPPARRSFLFSGPWRWALAGTAVAALIVAAFLAGRSYPRSPGPVPIAAAAADPQAGERILMVAVGDCLERSEMVLIELANAGSEGPMDISSEQARAADLVSETRLYRQTATHAGDAPLATVLDELERVLLDITHTPSQVSPGALDELRRRLQNDGILFKIRVLGSNLRNRQDPEGTLPASRQRL